MLRNQSEVKNPINGLHADSRIQQVHGVKIVNWLSFLRNTVKWLNYFHLFDNLQPEILIKTDVLNALYQIASRSLPTRAKLLKNFRLRRAITITI